MFITILSVKAKVKTYLGIYRLALRYWDIITQGLNLKSIPESTLRDRLKKSAINLENLQVSFFRYFLEITSIKKVSADKMPIQAKGLVLYKKYKKKVLFLRN